MAKQLSKEDILNAKAIHLYNEDTIYVELHDSEDVYGSYKGGEWFIKANFWDYWESSIMLSYFQYLTPDEALNILERWQSEPELNARENSNRLNNAITFATNKHNGQFRKATTIPYILHPLEVMQILHSMRADTNLLIAGLLHDTVEDTDTTLDEIKKLFGDDVAMLVSSNSEDKSKSWEERKQHTINDLAKADTRVKMLIMADKLANIRSIAYDYKHIGDKLWERFNAPKEKQAWYYDGIADALYDMQFIPECKSAYWEFTRLFKDVFVKFYFDENEETLYQSCTSETIFCFKRIKLQWEDYKDALASDISGRLHPSPSPNREFFSVRIPDSAKEISREHAELIEDFWTQKLK